MSRENELRQFIADEGEALLRTLRFYLYRAGLTTQGQPLESAARELLNDVVAEALAHEDRFRPGAKPRPWLLGIAANLVKRRQVELARRDRREPLARDLLPDDGLSDDDLFDWLAGVSPDMSESDEAVRAILSGVSPEDQRVLRLAILGGLDGAALGRALDISAGAARVRLHRALNRLRASYHKEAQDG